MKVGRKIFYDIITGVRIVDTGQWDNAVRDKTVEEEIASYPQLSERNRSTFDVIKLDYGQYTQDFVECSGYRVNPEIRELEFSYPDPNGPEDPIIVAKPLTVQITELKQENALINEAIDVNSLMQQELLELLIDMGVI